MPRLIVNIDYKFQCPEGQDAHQTGACILRHLADGLDQHDPTTELSDGQGKIVGMIDIEED